ncbi:CoA-binding protein [Parapusillimonas granuli]|uniref:CoA-binding protein n=1 Tax=Parapusillimonas granuli TaxID=380911 RepID=A0A853FT15_9BURK|nr:CoA-binding protein [Parapusillimonas granuli]NYT47818.1 CoA-binding protein [Parapusillimonas granuli]
MSVQKQIESILNPRSVAVIGASNDTNKWGGSVLALLRKFGFKGELFPINPKADMVQGLKAYGSVSQVGQAGVGAVLVMTAQFAESGPEGMALQQEVEDIVSRAGMRMIGPNCMGYFSSASDLCLLNAQAFIRNDTMHKGHIALISQSGALAGAMLARSYDIGAAFSFCVSLGNQADLEICDFLEYAIADANTRVIALYVEGLKNPGRFTALLEAARQAGKPVLVTKAGRSSSGTKAVQSHTASMAGAYQTFRAGGRRPGIRRKAHTLVAHGAENHQARRRPHASALASGNRLPRHGRAERSDDRAGRHRRGGRVQGKARAQIRKPLIRLSSRGNHD